MFRRFILAAAAGLLLAGFASPAIADEPIHSLVVKWRDDALPAAAQALSAQQLREFADALQTPFSIVGRTGDGAFEVELLAPLQVDEARTALNRVRMLPAVLYGNLVPAAAPGAGGTNVAASIALQGPPVRRLIVKYRDFATTLAAAQNRPLADALVNQLSAWAGQTVTHYRAMSGGAYVVRLSQALSPEAAQALARYLATDPGIEYAHPDLMKKPTLVPNDPLYPLQWHYQSSPTEMAGVNLPPAWSITTGSSSIFIGVIDTGILPHPDLSGRYIGGYDMISDCAVANDNSAPCTFSPLPYNAGNPPQPSFNSRDSDPTDPGDWVTVAESTNPPPNPAPPPYYGWFAGCPPSNSSWHGTHVAGTIAAASNTLTPTGVAGINWVSQIVPVRVLGKCGGYDSDIIDAIVWAVGGLVPGAPINPHPVRVINMSIGGPGACGAFQNAINTALTAGAVLAVAAGNGNQDASNSSPANCNGVITVAALARSGKRASYSNFGPLIEIAAPGGGATNSTDFVLSTLNDGTTSPDLAPTGWDYVYYAGTSMATPHVAGIASLMLSVNPALTPAQVLAKIQSSARAFPLFFSGGCSTSGTKSCGAGIIDAGAAVQAALPVATPTTTTLISSLNPSNVGDPVSLTATVSGGSNPTGTVNFTDGGNSIPGCATVTLSSGSAQCPANALAQGSHSIVAKYSGDAGNAASQSAPPLSQNVNGGGGGGGGSTNVALAANGGVASASSSSIGYPASAVNNGDRAGLNSGFGGVWKDSTRGIFPDWVEIDFNGAKTLDHVIVYSVQDNSPVDPSDTLTFTLNGVTAFDVQSWNGTAWVTLGSVSGNNLVKRSVAFPATTTSKIRVLINATISGRNSMLTEIEAWTTGGGGGGPAPTTTTLISSLNPSNVGDPVTLTATVGGGSNPTGTVNFTDGASSISGCATVTLSGGSAQCPANALAQGTHSIVAQYSGDAGNAASQSTPPLSQVVNGGGGGGGGSTNVALAANGGVASASSSGLGYSASAVNNGDRSGISGVWKDATLQFFPDWVEIDFNGAKTIDHVIVYSVQDSTTPVDPSDTLTFTRSGITAFDIQSWNGTTWVTLGSVSGNNLVKRSVAFPATITSKIRVLINAVSNGRYSMVAEIEAWTP